VYICLCIYVSMCVYVQVYVSVHVCVSVCVRARECKHICDARTHTHMRTCVHAYTRTQPQLYVDLSLQLQSSEPTCMTVDEFRILSCTGATTFDVDADCVPAILGLGFFFWERGGGVEVWWVGVVCCFLG
jgi:hypothetical protein